MKRRHVLEVCRAVLGFGLLPGPWPIVQAQARTADDDTWFDTARRRHVPLRLRWPDGDAPCALIVHSHGLGGSREGGDSWGRAWRKAGFAVLHLQHPGSDREVLRSGMAALRRAASGEQLVARVDDVRFVIDEVERRTLSGIEPWSRVRLDAIGASGHSFGAQTVQALAGKRFPVLAPELSEPRLRAFVALSPSLGRNDPASPAQQFGAVTRPFLAVTGSEDGDPLGGTLTGEDRARVYDGLPSGRRALLWLANADHMTFGGYAEPPIRGWRAAFRREPTVAALEHAHHALVARVTSLWWRAHMLGDALAAAALSAPEGLAAGDRWRMD